jgi:hypothetical protein
MTNKGLKVVVAMNPALRRRCAKVQELLAKAAVEEIDTRYEAGAVIRSIADGKSLYGERAVERVAEALGRDPGTLYRYATVVKTWSREEIQVLSRQASAHRVSLAWSHWVELTRARSAWRPWLERAVDGRWSARELGRQIGLAHSDSSSRAEDTTRAALLHSVQVAERLDVELRSFAVLAERLATTSPRAPEMEALLARAAGAFEGVARRTSEALARVRGLTAGAAIEVGLGSLVRLNPAVRPARRSTRYPRCVRRSSVRGLGDGKGAGV